MSDQNQHGEYAYLDLLRKVLEEGVEKPDRTGVGTLSLFGSRMEFDISETIPLLTTKKVFWKTVLKELIFFLSGKTDNRILQEQGCRIWNGNSSREYLDSIGQTHRREGDMGPFYSFQWIHSGAEYVDCDTDYTGKGVNQIAEVVRLLKEDPHSRRIILSAWNPSQSKEMCLNPCHVMAQWYVVDGKLSCQMYQRSGDMFLGVPFNIASYTMLTYMLAHLTGLKPDKFVHVIGDTHIYKNHLEQTRKQLERDPYPFPTLVIKRNAEAEGVIQSMDDFKLEDFEIVDYKCHPYIKAPMAV